MKAQNIDMFEKTRNDSQIKLIQVPFNINIIKKMQNMFYHSHNSKSIK
jgi:hypothetical protein